MTKTRAFLLRKIDYSETSLVAVFFTEDHGKVQFLIKGAKRAKGSFRSSFEHFSCYEILFKHRSDSRGLTILREAHLIEGFSGIRRDLDRFYTANYWIELIDSLTVVEDAHPPLFDLFLEMLNRLNSFQEGISLEGLSRSFEVRLLELLGFLGDFAHCSSCQRDCSEEFYIDTRLARPHCSGCRTVQSVMYPSEVVRGMAILKNGKDLNVAFSTLKQIQKLLWFYIDFHLEKPLKSRKFLDSELNIKH